MRENMYVFIRRKLLNLEKKLEAEELKQVLLDVPDSVFEMVKKVPEGAKTLTGWDFDYRIIQISCIDPY